MKQWIIGLIILSSVLSLQVFSAELLVEAESFDFKYDKGGLDYNGNVLLYGDGSYNKADRTDTGWVLDQQFMDQMGSPYLMAQGAGCPVSDARKEVVFPSVGTYRVWVRTFDWVGRWRDLPSTSPKQSSGHAPGRFEVYVNGTALIPPVTGYAPETTAFGAHGIDWYWQEGGTVAISNPASVEIRLHDLTGMSGRCDAIYFTTDMSFIPPNSGPEMAQWRQSLLGTATLQQGGDYDLVVVGGGIAGTCAAISAARQGLTVALIQDRPVLGGNNSSEVRVGAGGNINYSPYAAIGNIVKSVSASPGNAAPPASYLDVQRHSYVEAETNIALFLNQRVNQVEMNGASISGVIAEHTQTGQRIHFTGRCYVDCTGDAVVGYLAGADYEMTLTSSSNGNNRMGSSNLWRLVDTGTPKSFQSCPWALHFEVGDFPAEKISQWFWESGFFHDPFEKDEYIRDWNFRAAYGAWDTMKNKMTSYTNYLPHWQAYIGGKRESRRLLGDIILDDDDFFKSVMYKDGCVPTSWGRDLHWPNATYQPGFEGDEFISTYTGPGYTVPYWIPYRCLYSRNITNLFMAGRNISVTHYGLGPVRVQKTTGMMGEIVGMAAAVCKEKNTTPRGVYTDYLRQLQSRMGKVDFSAPAAPGNLKATKGDDSVILDWDTNSEADIKGYCVYRSTTSEGDYVQIASAFNSNYTDNTVVAGARYYYVVSAMDTLFNESGLSNQADVIVPKSWFGKIGPNYAMNSQGAVVSTTSSNYRGTVTLVNDGLIDITNNDLRWLTTTIPNYVTFTLKTTRYISAARVISGYNNGGVLDSAITDFHFEYWNGTAWAAIPNSSVTGNSKNIWTGRFDAVSSRNIRLVVTKTPGNYSRLWEVELYHPDSDLIADGTVSIPDLLTLSDQWLCSGAGLGADFYASRNNMVDISDFSILADFWNW